MSVPQTVGVHDVTGTVTDEYGNVAVCVFEFIVNDLIEPNKFTQTKEPVINPETVTESVTLPSPVLNCPANRVAVSDGADYKLAIADLDVTASQEGNTAYNPVFLYNPPIDSLLSAPIVTTVAVVLGHCPKPAGYCTETGRVAAPKECGGVLGWQCTDTSNQIGFVPCDSSKAVDTYLWPNAQCANPKDYSCEIELTVSDESLAPEIVCSPLDVLVKDGDDIMFHQEYAENGLTITRSNQIQTITYKNSKSEDALTTPFDTYGEHQVLATVTDNLGLESTCYIMITFWEDIPFTLCPTTKEVLDVNLELTSSEMLEFQTLAFEDNKYSVPFSTSKIPESELSALVESSNAEAQISYEYIPLQTNLDTRTENPKYNVVAISTFGTTGKGACMFELEIILNPLITSGCGSDQVVQANGEGEYVFKKSDFVFKSDAQDLTGSINFMDNRGTTSSDWTLIFENIESTYAENVILGKGRFTTRWLISTKDKAYSKECIFTITVEQITRHLLEDKNTISYDFNYEQKEDESKFDAWKRHILQTSNDSTIPSESDPNGQYDFYYYAEDASGNSGTLTIGIEMIEAGEPFVDCAGCQNPYVNYPVEYPVYICAGTNDSDVNGTLYTPIVVNHSDLVSRMSAENQLGKWLDQFPGQMINLTANEENGHLYSTDYENDSWVYLDCNCELDRTILSPDREFGSRYDTNDWTAIPVPLAYDLFDAELTTISDQVLSPLPENNSLAFIGFFATDNSDLTGGCWMEVLYDTQQPNCDPWGGTAILEEVNGTYQTGEIDFLDPALQNDGFYENNSVIINATLIPSGNFTIGAVNSTFTIPDLSVYITNLTATYYIEDYAGNVATCDWILTVYNPSACTFGGCTDDDPPTVVCPTSQAGECASAVMGVDGRVTWDAPVIDDDYGIKNYSANYYSGDILPLGVNTITWTVFDYSNQSATCSFTITISDSIAPHVICPVDERINTGNSLTGAYSVNFTADDDCPLTNQITVFDGSVTHNMTMTYFNQSANTDSNFTTTYLGEKIFNLNLAIGVNSLNYIIEDQSGNQKTCVWEVAVDDDYPPVITCPSNVYKKLGIGQTETQVTWESPNVVDYSAYTVTYNYSLDHNYTLGVYYVLANATDSFNNSDTCVFTVTIDTSYSPSFLDAALSKVHVQDFGNDTVAQFGATLNIITAHTLYHDINGAASLSVAAQGHPSIISTSCDVNSDVYCINTHTVDVYFDGCEIDKKSYQFQFNTTCTPSDCPHSDASYLVTVSISAANYCWQDLASVSIEANFVLMANTTLQQYLADIQTAGESNYRVTVNDYSSISSIKHDEPIAGVIEVLSNSIKVGKVELKSLDRAYYNDSLHTDLISTSSILSSLDDFTDALYHTSFEYLDTRSIPLETTYFTRYTAIVEITYDVGTRRRLLAINIDDNHDERSVSADLLINNRAESLVTASEDGLLLLKLDQCNDLNYYEVEQNFVESFSTALRLPQEYLKLRLLDNCYIQLSISSSCQNDNFIVNDVIHELCNNIIANPIHIFHTLIRKTQSDDLGKQTNFAAFQSEFCVTEQEAIVYDEQNKYSETSKDSLVSFFSTESTNKSINYIPYVVGVVIGMVVPAMYNYYKKSSA
jgi:hypothetical protein